jgi:hypothetical protein
MSEDDLLERRHRASIGKQPLVVRQTDQDLQFELLERLEKLEALSESSKNDLKALSEHSQASRLDARSMIALAAIALSIAGYILQDARNSSRQDAEIGTTKARVANLERIAATNTEARIRNEVQLGELRDGQGEIKRMLEAHDSESKKVQRQK